MGAGAGRRAAGDRAARRRALADTGELPRPSTPSVLGEARPSWARRPARPRRNSNQPRLDPGWLAAPVGKVRVAKVFPASVYDAEVCWYDTERWPGWIDGLRRGLSADA